MYRGERSLPPRLWSTAWKVNLCKEVHLLNALYMRVHALSVCTLCPVSMDTVLVCGGLAESSLSGFVVHLCVSCACVVCNSAANTFL